MSSRSRSPAAKKDGKEDKASTKEATSDGKKPAFVPPPRPEGLRGSLLRTYAVLVGSFLVFALLGESMKHDIPEGKFEKRDGTLINVADFDPVAQGPFPKCHPHFGEHEVTSDGSSTWVKNNDAPSGGPFPPGHPENPDWIEKSDAIQKKIWKETRFKWEGLQPNLHLLTLATLCVFLGCKHGVWCFTEAKESRQANQVLQSGDAAWFPVMGSCMLFGLFIVLKYLGKDWVKMAITCAITTACTFGVGTNTDAIFALLRNKTSPVLLRIPVLDEKVTLLQILGSLVGAAMAACYFLTKNWIVNNVFGVSFCLLAMRSVDLGSFKTGAILLIGLFFYDVFWVFGSKSVFGSNVMVSVATGLDAPIKLMFPRAFTGCGLFQHGMLGLGDIAVPGLFIAFMAKWDAVKMGEKASSSFVYLNCIMVAYVLSLITTVAIMLIFNHAQPALLYIVPYILITAVGVALVRGEFKDLWAYSIEDETEEEKTKATDEKKSK
mmetsp:Transcript_21729/g.38931  ORF Transcript_21729/g.38931 Transcript_21729/m.38931 type:complete len:492 (-) Transcript_21729:208-1683(-)|eukprot:CAMPEP_0197655864 /NCGR_PEP_ID=MMETSP1338-20131121/39714_1 /TAXON_ID=43686 ORGANISM="Pelagodinium beii, Strain RCC1491" /NCGR_SAMPLE_ID=MMETSP1338 /ASSEMBLY_ACC=CAM_ASM_000754 /LENGTH=491 /DNA_ID=CAMNT_0043231597 /DNA_START=52 /DNA_END=1527 /DNA_ORIENTATION=+